MRALFLSVHRPNRAPGQRFRFEQYLPHLVASGVECRHLWALEEQHERTYYGRVSRRAKAEAGVRLVVREAAQLARAALPRADVALVQREAFFAGPPVVEWALGLGGVPYIFDFDDSIWIAGVSEANKAFSFVKPAGKTDWLIRNAALVFAGNEYLASYARRLNSKVVVVPTTIDTVSYVPRATSKPSGSPVCVGWSGSFSTIAHFQLAIPALRRVKARFGDAVCFRVIGDGNFKVPELGIVGQPWIAASEVPDLHEIDIGLMPLADDEWSRGKCGLKGLQYMALGIPTLMSPVGVNSEIIQEGVSGYLPRTEDEWVDRISGLVQSAELRQRMGAAGREVVVRRYSVEAWRGRYLEYLTAVAGRQDIKS